MSKVSSDSEKLAKGQQVFTACAFIHKKINDVDHVFLATRAATKKFLPNVYELPGGHVDFGEEITNGLAREVMEEFAVKVTIGDPFYVYTYQNKVKQSHSIEIVYFAKFAEPEENIVTQPEDHSGYGWFTEEQVRNEVAKNRKGVTELETIQITDNVDHEVLAMLKGFDLLKNESLDLG